MIDVYKHTGMRNPPPAVYGSARECGFGGKREDLFRQIVILDAQVCACAARGDWLEPVIHEQAHQMEENPMWPDAAAAGFVRKFLQKNRECFYRLLRGVEISKVSTAYRGAVQAYMLVLLMDGVAPSQWREHTQELFSRLRPRWLGNVRDEIFAEYAALYQDADSVLTQRDLVLLRQCRSGCVQVMEKMKETVLKIAEYEDAVICLEALSERCADPITSCSAPSQTDDKPVEPSAPAKQPVWAEVGSWKFCLNSAEEKLRLIYFLESCCASLLEKEIPWQVCAKEHWSRFYPEVAFDRTVEDKLWSVLRRRRTTGIFGAYCLAIGVVFQYGLKGVNSGSHLYHLLLGRAAGMAAAYALEDTHGSPFGGKLDGPLNDAIDYRKRVPVPYAIPAQDEEQQLQELLALYQRDGRYDPVLLAGAVSMRHVFRKNFQALESRIHEANESNVLISQMRSQLSDMRGDLEKADFLIKRSLVCHLDRGSSGYRLSQLYRFAHGLDEKDSEQVREMLYTLFILLENEGIRPVCGERLGQEIPETDELFDKIIPNMGPEEEGKRVLQYPGWSVGGVQIEPPVYISIKE